MKKKPTKIQLKFEVSNEDKTMTTPKHTPGEQENKPENKTPYIKPKCPTCGSVNWVPRLKTKDAFCRNCGGVFKLGEVATADDNHTKRIRND